MKMPSKDSGPETSDAELAPALSAQETILSGSSDSLLQVADDSELTEDLALALLKRSDLKSETLEHLGKSTICAKSHKVKLAIVSHLRTPRYVSLSLLRQLFTFELMKVTLTPVVPGDIKMAADEALINRLETISIGEKLSLARRASGRIAGELLLDSEPRVMQTALENPRLTETVIIRPLMRPTACPTAFVHAVCRHQKWCLRREVRIALLRNEKTPLAYASEFARSFPPALLREILRNSRLPGSIKASLLRDLHARM